MCQQVEGRIVVKEKVVRSPALTADHIGSLDGIAAEKDRLYLVSKRTSKQLL